LWGASVENHGARIVCSEDCTNKGQTHRVFDYSGAVKTPWWKKMDIISLRWKTLRGKERTGNIDEKHHKKMRNFPVKLH
jgi:hypothetical protein